MPNLVRVFRATVKPGMADEFRAFFTDIALPILHDCQGMLDVTIGWPIESAPNEFLMITTWDGPGSLKLFAGEDWEEAVIDPREAHLLDQVQVHHYYQASETA